MKPQGLPADAEVPSIFARRYGWLAVVVAAPALTPLLTPDWFTGHDSLHLVRLFEQDLMIRAGHFPVRWYPDVSAGYGSPHPQFYAPLLYLLAQLFHFFWVSQDNALKLAVGLVWIGAGYGMFRLVRPWFGAGAALVASAAYTYVPYHIADLYVRAALSELTVFATLPLTLHSFESLILKRSPRSVATAGGLLGLLLISHTITVMLVPALLVLWVTLLLLHRKPGSSVLPRTALAIGLGFGIAAFFLIPVVAERNAIDATIYSAGYFNWRQHFPTLSQLLWSPWGFGLSAPGQPDGFSFRLGELHLVLALVGLVLWWFRSSDYPKAARPGVHYAVILTVSGVLLSLSVSTPLWSSVTPLTWVQFPWRFLLFPAFGMSILTAAAAFAINRVVEKRSYPAERPQFPRLHLRPASLALTLGFVLWALPLISVGGFVPSQLAHLADDPNLQSQVLAEGPPGRLTRQFVRRTTISWIDHLPTGGFPRPTADDLERPLVEVDLGSANIEQLEMGPLRYSMRITAAVPSRIRLNVHAFPGWRWKIDGRTVLGAASQGRPVLMVDVPPGEHRVLAGLSSTWPKRTGDLVSLLSLAAAALLIILPNKGNEAAT